MADSDLIGKVVHFYDKISVAVIKLDKTLKVGDKVKFVHGDDSFDQTVESMQFDHKPIEEGKKGQEIAIKIDKQVKPGTLVNK